MSPYCCPFAPRPAAADIIKAIMAGQRTGQPAHGRNGSCAALLAAGAAAARTGPRHERWTGGSCGPDTGACRRGRASNKHGIAPGRSRRLHLGLPPRRVGVRIRQRSARTCPGGPGGLAGRGRREVRLRERVSIRAVPGVRPGRPAESGRGRRLVRPARRRDRRPRPGPGGRPAAMAAARPSGPARSPSTSSRDPTGHGRSTAAAGAPDPRGTPIQQSGRQCVSTHPYSLGGRRARSASSATGHIYAYGGAVRAIEVILGAAI